MRRRRIAGAKGLNLPAFLPVTGVRLHDTPGAVHAAV